jgi:hypothetical protein
MNWQAKPKPLRLVYATRISTPQTTAIVPAPCGPPAPVVVNAIAVTPVMPLTAARVGECLDSVHPALPGRVHVSWQDAGGQQAAWLPKLAGLTIQTGDRVLVQWPIDFAEPIVIGVLDSAD